MQELAQAIVLSLSLAALYSAVAAGITLEFGVSGIINFAHGEFVMIGAYVAFFLHANAGWHPLIALIAAAVVMAALSAVVYFCFLAQVLKAVQHNQLVATLGLSIIMTNLAIIWWGTDLRAPQVEHLLPSLKAGEVVLPGNNLFVILVVVAAYAAMAAFLRFTRFGLMMRLASEDRELAALAGINTNAAFATSFVVGGAMAGVAGGLVAVVLYVHPLVGLELVLPAFAAVVLGGLGSVAGALVGATVLALAQQLAATYGSQGSSWGYGVAFLVLVIALIVRPRGIFGRPEVARG